MKLRDRIPLILARLEDAYPDAHCALHYRNAFELLVATILSAQCTDERVNMVTPALFALCPTPMDVVETPLFKIEEIIRSTGFYHAKAKNILGACRIIVEHFDGDVPDTLDDLVKLPGVGRKTANVVLGNAFDTPGITVDTHVGRLSRRLGLTKHDDPVKVEFALNKLIPPADWTNFSHRLIFHGRRVCFARKPACSECTLADLCPKVGVPGSKLQVPNPKTRPGQPET
jgi:endonuclease III